MRQTAFFVDRLNILSLPALATHPDFRACSRVHVLSSSPLAARVLRFLKRRHVGFSLIHVHNVMGDHFDGDGRTLRNHLEETLQRLFLALQECLEEAPLFRSALFRKMPRAWVSRYFVHCQETKTYERARDLIFLEHVRQRDQGHGPLFLEDSQLFPAMEAVAMPQPDHLVRYGRLRRTLNQACRLAGLFLAMLVLPFWHLLHSVLPAGEAPRESGPERILVQCAWGYNSSVKNDLHFLQNGHVPPKNVLYYLTRPDTPLTQDMVHDISTMGLGGVVCPRKITSVDGVRFFLQKLFGRGQVPTWDGREHFWRAPSSLAWQILRATFLVAKAAFRNIRRPFLDQTCQMSILCDTLSFFFSFLYWRAFFSAMKAQVHISYSGDCGAIHTLQSLAMDAVDGVNVRSNYSYVMIQDINYSREFHMYFPWGQQQKCHMAMENLYCRSIFQIGYIFDYALESLKPVHTNRMHSEGFAVTLFDESFNASTTLSHAALNAFYQVFFDMLEEHACLRVYVKSKLYGRDALAGLFPGLIAAEATRRLTVFPNTLLPCQASVEANLVVCCGLNTAGIEAALLGKPVVFLLHDKGRCPQFERLGQGRVVYHGLEAFRQDLREILVHGRWPQGLGDIGQALEELDPFRDGDSGARMGSVLAKFMEEIRAGADGREALRSCVEAYRAAHGDRALLDESPDLWPDRS